MPRPFFIKIFLATLLILAALVQASPLAAEGELMRALKSREAFFNSPEKLNSRADWLVLIKEFEDAALAQENPRHASRARYIAADLCFDSAVKFKQNADYETSARLAKRAVRDCPQCPHSPEAQLIYGRALMAQKQLDQATKELMKVELNYPDSPEVAEARKLLARLRGGPPPTVETAGSGRTPTSQTPQTVSDPPAGTDPPKKTASSPAADKKSSGPKTTLKIPAAPAARGDGRAQVYFITLEDGAGHTIVTAYVDKVTPYVYNLIPPSRSGGTFRVYADLKGAVIAPRTRLQLPGQTGLVKLVKMNQYKDDVVRVVMDMAEPHNYRPTFLDNPPRLVFQVARDAASLPAQTAEAQPAPPEAAPTPPAKSVGQGKGKGKGVKGPEESMVRQLGLKVRTIVIDPGHGGKDVGASGHGVKEKDIVLKLSRKVAERIEKRLKLNVHLTRDDDRFITLERRTKIAKDKGADLFISLHVNANNLAEVEGFETYVLNFATDRSAMAVAARENAESNKSVAELQDLLTIIAKNTKIAESRAMAQTLHKAALTAVNKKHKVRDLGVKEAPFFVLVGADVPAILVEIGFLTNDKDATRLAREDYLDAVADGLVNGLENYVNGF